MKPLPIVHLNGFPGTGKLTIAERLTARLNMLFDEHTTQPTMSGFTEKKPSTTTKSAKLVHNHLLIDPANAVLHRTQPGYQTLRKALRDAIFGILVDEESTHDTLYIFTDWQSGDSVGSRVCEDFQNMAIARGSEFVPVIISCEQEENARRLVSADRSKFGKVTDVNLLLQFRLQRTPAPVFQFRGNDNRIEVDVTDLSSEEAAEIIFEHILSLKVVL